MKERENAESYRVQIRDAFAVFDTDGDGTLTANELVSVLIQVATHPSSACTLSYHFLPACSLQPAACTLSCHLLPACSLGSTGLGVYKVQKV